MSSSASPTQSFNKIVFCPFLDLFISKEFNATSTVSELSVRDLMRGALSKRYPAASALTLQLEQNVSPRTFRGAQTTAVNLFSSMRDKILHRPGTEQVRHVLCSALATSKY